MDRDMMVDLLGAQNWQDVLIAFGLMDADEILGELDSMFPTENNEDLAQAIYEALN